MELQNETRRILLYVWNIRPEIKISDEILIFTYETMDWIQINVGNPESFASVNLFEQKSLKSFRQSGNGIEAIATVKRGLIIAELIRSELSSDMN